MKKYVLLKGRIATSCQIILLVGGGMEIRKTQKNKIESSIYILTLPHLTCLLDSPHPRAGFGFKTLQIGPVGAVS